MKRGWKMLLICYLALSITACSLATDQGQDQRSQQLNQAQSSHDISKGSWNQRSKTTPQRLEDKGVGEQHPPRSLNTKPQFHSLAGGPESTGRLIQPMDNAVLQRKYPHLFALNGPKVPKVALTFDDGPDRRFTPQVLDILKKHQVKATFFLVGSRVAALPDITKRIAAEGHVIGNHTYWHPKFWRESTGRRHWEVVSTEQAIEQAAGIKPRLFRPPYGALTDEVIQELGALHYSIIGWSADSLDWKQLPASDVEANVLKDLRPGAIILMHSGGDWTQDLSNMVEALDKLIPKLKERGLQPVTIPELLNIPSKK